MIYEIKQLFLVFSLTAVCFLAEVSYVIKRQLLRVIKQ
jgi:hypothetical protein